MFLALIFNKDSATFIISREASTGKIEKPLFKSSCDAEPVPQPRSSTFPSLTIISIKISRFVSLKSFDIKKLKKEIKLIKPDLIIITCSYIIPEELLNVSKKSKWINKHASLLPLTKGLFPFVWNVIHNRSQGISFHEVTKEIDSGSIIYQEEITEQQSMVAFYKDIYFSFEKYFYNFISSFEKNIQIENHGGDYFSIPNKKDLKLFKNKGGKIITFKDIYG